MDGLEHDDGIGGGFSRRDALKRGGIVVGAAALWTTPIVQTLGARPAAASTLEIADFCPAKQGSITRLVLRYTGKGCENQVGQLAASEGCSGDGPLPQTAWIEITLGSNGNNEITFTGEVTAFVDEIDTGIPRSPQPSTWMRVYDSQGGTLLSTSRFHTSCSEELFLGEQYGPAEIFDGDWVPN